MRILQVTGLQIPLTRVVSIWRGKKKKKDKCDYKRVMNKTLPSLLNMQ